MATVAHPGARCCWTDRWTGRGAVGRWTQLIHSWDIARATGGDERLDPELVEYVCERFKPLDELLRQPWAFGPKITAPGGR